MFIYGETQILVRVNFSSDTMETKKVRHFEVIKKQLSNVNLVSGKNTYGNKGEKKYTLK